MYAHHPEPYKVRYASLLQRVAHARREASQTRERAAAAIIHARQVGGSPDAHIRAGASVRLPGRR